ncbi:glycosyltransferase [Kitasatospora sp. NPDC058965]|uniref:glycosyltransferase n=1 Tax=Kitasatospora sp. NPDC058965 TaxID=3346682 RepID=UPI0036BB2EE3
MARESTVTAAPPTRLRRVGGRGPWPQWVPRAMLPVALAVWLVSLRRVQLERMGDLGLLQVLPVWFWVAVALLTLGFVAALRDLRVGKGWLAGYLLALVMMIHATPSLLYPALRYSWAWKHIAVLDAMLRHNGTVPNAQGLDIYNQWPGFFQINALLLRVTGMHSALGYAAWAPVFFNVLLLGPLLLLYRSVSSDRRVVWGGVWIFYSASWVGQDYFAPQAFAFLLYASLLAVLIRRLHEPGVHGWPPGRLLMLLLIEFAIASSHQLTPLMLISALLMLALPRRNRRTVLPLLAGAVGFTVLWDATVARPYLSANLHDLLHALTSPDANVLSGLAGLGAAAPGQVLVAWVDRGMSAALFALAAVAYWRRPWTRRTGVPLLALSPLPLLVANNYGGEMIFRAYLFSLPATAFLTAALLFAPSERPRLRAVVVTGLLGTLLVGLFFGYYSKESMNWFSTDEVAAVRTTIDRAPPGSRIVSVTGDLPGADLHYDEHSRVVFSQDTLAERRALLVDPTSAILHAQVGANGPTYLVLTRAQAAECYLTGTLPADTVARLRAAADALPALTPVYRGPDAVVYQYVATTGTP